MASGSETVGFLTISCFLQSPSSQEWKHIRDLKDTMISLFFVSC